MRFAGWRARPTVPASGPSPLLADADGIIGASARRTDLLLLLAALVALAYAALWAIGLASIHTAPPLDSAEQLVWSYSLEGGYWKHPPLPSWIMHAMVQLFGPSIALTFFVTLFSAALALLCMWRLGCEFMSPMRSLAAAALTSLIGYHSWNADSYNHNSALLPFQAATILFFYLALRRERWSLWIVSGVCAGLAMLVKYVAILPLAGLLLYVLLDRQVRTSRTFGGMLAALAAALVVFAPHALWLAANHYMPVQYAHAVAVPLAGPGAWLVNLGDFAFGQLLRLLPLLGVLAWMGWQLRRAPTTGAAPTVQPQARLFLLTVGLSPIALVILGGALTGHEIVPRWGYNAFLLAGWLVMAFVRWPEHKLTALVRTCVAVQVTLWVLLVAALPRVMDAVHWQARANFPGRELATLAKNTWRSHSGRPLRLVIGDVWLGGTVAAFKQAPLAVMIDGVPNRSMWVKDRDLADCGALVLQDRTEYSSPRMPELDRYFAEATDQGEWQLGWAPSRGLHAPPAPPVRIAWAFIPPAPGAACGL